MFSDSTLGLLPTTALAALSNALTGKAASLAGIISAKKARILRLNGYNEIATVSRGRVTVDLVHTKAAAETNSEQVAGAASTAGIAKTLLEGGQEAYDPATLAPGVVGDEAQVDTMNSELSEQADFTNNQDWISESLEYQKSVLQKDIESKRAELDAARESLEQVNEVIKKRSIPVADGGLPDPKVRYENITTAIENTILELSKSQGPAGTGIVSEAEIQMLQDELHKASTLDVTRYEKYVIDRIIVPFQENEAALDIIRAQLLGEKVEIADEPIFDTVFGPPVCYEGKFILSEDGIYYDSRNGGIPYIAAQKINAASWQLRYASNKGGKGELYSPQQVGRLADTIFDEDYKNESGAVLDFYKYDDILRGLQNDKNLQIADVSAKIDDLISLGGYDASSAIVKNYKESYAAVAYTYDSKIKKRKKQLQVAALFGPFGVTTVTHELGEGVFYKKFSPATTSILENPCGGASGVSGLEFDGPGGVVGEIAGIGGTHIPVALDTTVEYIERIPLNDFSYLKTIGIVPELLVQKSAMLHSSDLDDTTLPLAPVFLTHGPGSPVDAIPEMSIAPMGVTDWVNTSGDTDFSGTIPYVRSLDDSIVRENLIICYNFLEPSSVVDPSSTVFGVRNFSETGRGLDAKLVGNSASSVFLSGVTIPYLQGSLFNPNSKYGLRYGSVSGSYVRLPNNYRDNKPYPASQPLDDLLYGDKGWSMDFWVYAGSGLSSTLTYNHRYKLIASNENCGKAFFGRMYDGGKTLVTASTSDRPVGDKSRTKGIMVGFRDRGDPGTSNASGLEFVVLPTVSQNDEKWGKSVCIVESVSGDGIGAGCDSELGFKIPVSVTSLSGYTIGDASGGFTHYNLTCDLSSNAISLYVNGQLLSSSSLNTAFGTTIGSPLNLPTAITEGHFQDRTGKHGEKLYDRSLPETPIFTPWILGGGFTDGIGHEDPPIFSSTFPGFLGTNTNDSYFTTSYGASGGPVGQHTVLTTDVPGLGGYAATSYKIPRSGLDGHIGSFKMYSAPLTKEDVLINYEAQRPFFTGIQIPFRLL
tara:strand:- start:17041 stop:20166 length:3126 start_codon:yes stop_codon:yes gene_type:complete